MISGNNVRSAREVMFTENVGVQRSGSCYPLAGCTDASCVGSCGSQAKNSHCLGNDLCCCRQ